MNIAFLGLGTMGLPMAANLLRAEHRLTVFNRSRPAVERARHESRQAIDRMAAPPGASIAGALTAKT